MIPVCDSVTGTAKTQRDWLSTRAQIVGMSCACAGAAAFLYAVDPSHHAVYPQCMLYNLTGYYCAGCGATRACYALLHGRVVEALHDNALFVGVLPLLIYLAGAHMVEAWRRNAWPRTTLDERKLIRRSAWIFAVMTVFMVVRNLPGWPFDWLKPLAE